MLPEGVVPELARVQHTDSAEIGVFEDRLTDGTIVICALDNLGKGAGGQAVQNANLPFGYEETTGLRLSGGAGLVLRLGGRLLILAREKPVRQGRREGEYAGTLARLRTRPDAALQPPRTRATSGTEH